jgi:hypothetical protein
MDYIIPAFSMLALDSLYLSNIGGPLFAKMVNKIQKAKKYHLMIGAGVSLASYMAFIQSINILFDVIYHKKKKETLTESINVLFEKKKMTKKEKVTLGAKIVAAPTIISAASGVDMGVKKGTDSLAYRIKLGNDKRMKSKSVSDELTKKIYKQYNKGRNKAILKSRLVHGSKGGVKGAAIGSGVGLGALATGAVIVAAINKKRREAKKKNEQR